jgi:anti-sigma B factor antagonist
MNGPTPFSCTFSGADPVVVTVRGEIDLASAPELAGLLVELTGQGHRYIAVDLASVEFMDSTGVRALIDASERLRSAGGRLVIQAAHARVERVLELTGVDRLLRAPEGAELAEGGD